MLARIVVIEDDVYMREELIDMLKKTGYRRTSSFELLKRYLEERADEWND